MTEPRFTGFGAGLVDFYRGLHAENSREYFHGHRDTYEDDVRTPLELLAGELGEEFGEPKVFRPNRDLRFTPDKRPYKEQASLVVEATGRDEPSTGALYAQVSADGLLVAGGWYMPTKGQLAAFRQAVDDGEPGDEIDRLLASSSDAGLELRTEGSLTTAPRGWPRDHPRIELLRLRALTLGVTHPPRAWLHTRECLTRIRSHWRDLGRWNGWLASLPVADADRGGPPPLSPTVSAPARGRGA